MAKLMSKSELIQKIVAQHSNKMARKDVKAVIESLNKGTKWHQSVHKGANDI